MEIDSNSFFDKVMAVYLTDKSPEEYVNHFSWVIEWYLKEYIMDEEITPPNYITIQNIFTRLKETEKYKALSYSEKRKLSKQSIIVMFKKNDSLNKYYIEDLNTHYKGVKIHKCNVIKKWKLFSV